MSVTEVKQAAGLAYREALPESGAEAPVALLVHGWPESSYMWRDILPAVAGAGWRAIAPDLPGYGDSPPDPPGTWERHMEALERFRQELGLDPVALVVHDWGGLIGLRWACEHPEAVAALVISDTGFFTDRQWHAMAKTLRTEGEGEQLLEALNREAFEQVLTQTCPAMTPDAIEEYWKSLADETRRRGALEMYRSGDFEKIAPYEGQLAQLGVPTLIIWGANDTFAGVKLAHRFQAEIPGSELLIIEDAGHFVFEEAPEQTGQAVADFLHPLSF